MNFRQDEEHQDILDMVHDFAVNEVKPLAAEIDRTEEFPMKNVKMMAEMGLMGIPFPEEYGGAGMDTLAYIQTVEELSKYCASTGVILSAHTSLCATPIYQFGSEEQKKKYLPKLCSGEWIGAFALTEPNAGTDASGQQTVAVDAGDHWVLNGSKIFITNAGAANVFFVLAMTDKSQGTKGISAFIVEKGYKGFSIGKHEDKLGIRASSTCELIFEDCIVPKENLVGELGKGFKYATKYITERKQFGRRISQFQNTQFEMAQMRAQTEAAKLLVYQAACAKDDHEPFSHKAAMAKLVAARNAMDVTTRCLQLYGGYGYTKDYPIERMMRDAKITEIYEGTSEVQMMVISGWMGVK
jgi:butyryl-CoA dehydrogenase